MSPDIPWCPQLGKPLGKVKLEDPQSQTCGMFTLPSEILKAIFTLSGSSIVPACRSSYQLFSPLCKFVDVHSYK